MKFIAFAMLLSGVSAQLCLPNSIGSVNLGDQPAATADEACRQNADCWAVRDNGATKTLFGGSVVQSYASGDTICYVPTNTDFHANNADVRSKYKSTGGLRDVESKDAIEITFVSNSRYSQYGAGDACANIAAAIGAPAYVASASQSPPCKIVKPSSASTYNGRYYGSGSYYGYVALATDSPTAAPTAVEVSASSMSGSQSTQVLVDNDDIYKCIRGACYVNTPSARDSWTAVASPQGDVPVDSTVQTSDGQFVIDGSGITFNGNRVRYTWPHECQCSSN